MIKHFPLFLFTCLAVSAAPLLQAGALTCAQAHRPVLPKILAKVDLQNAKDLVPFEEAYSQLFAQEFAARGLYIRRPSAREIETALKAGQFPDTPEVRSALFVVQKDGMDYSKPGALRLARGQYTPKKWNDDLNFEQVEKKMVSQLEKGEIANQISLGQYKNALSNLEGTATDVGGNKADQIQLITLKDGTRGVFKAMHVQQVVAEVAAYRFARALGLKLVPPTVVARHKGQIGSFQYFIENPATGLAKTHGAEREQKISREDRANMELYYIMSGNWDAHPGNRIVDLRGGLGLIDNEAITRPQFYRFGELPWFALLQSGKENKTEFVTPESNAFPFHEAKYFNKPSLKDVQSVMKDQSGWNPEVIESKLLWYQQDVGKVGIIEWQGTLWFQLNIPEYYRPRIPEYFPASTIQAASRLSMQDLKAIFQEPFRSIGGESIFKTADLRRVQERIQEVLKAQAGRSR